MKVSAVANLHRKFYRKLIFEDLFLHQASRAWKSSWLRLELWEILYTLSQLAPNENTAQEFQTSCALDFMLYALQEAVSEIGAVR